MPGGQGDPSSVLGGGDGWSCTAGAAERACAQFLQYIDSTQVQKHAGVAGGHRAAGQPRRGIERSASPAVKAAAAGTPTTPPTSPCTLDQALPTDPGLALDAAIANFFAGEGSNSAIINSVDSSSGH